MQAVPGVRVLEDGILEFTPDRYHGLELPESFAQNVKALHIKGPMDTRRERDFDVFLNFMEYVPFTTIRFNPDQHEEAGILHEFLDDVLNEPRPTAKIDTFEFAYGHAEPDPKSRDPPRKTTFPEWIALVLQLPLSRVRSIYFIEVVGLLNTVPLFGKYAPPKTVITGVHGEWRPEVFGLHQKMTAALSVYFVGCTVVNFRDIVMDWNRRPGAVRILVSIPRKGKERGLHDDAEIYFIGAGIPMNAESNVQFESFEQSKQRCMVFFDLGDLADSACEELILQGTSGLRYNDIVILRSDHMEPSRGVLNALYMLSRPPEGRQDWFIFSLNIVNQPDYDVAPLAQMLAIKPGPMIWVSSLTIGQCGIRNIDTLIDAMRAARVTTKICFTSVHWRDSVSPSTILQYACDPEAGLESLVVRRTDIGAIAWTYFRAKKSTPFVVAVLELVFDMTLRNVSAVVAAIRMSTKLKNLSLLFGEPDRSMEPVWDRNVSMILRAVASSRITDLLLPYMRYWGPDHAIAVRSANAVHMTMVHTGTVAKIMADNIDFPPGIIGMFVALDNQWLKQIQLVRAGEKDAIILR